MLQFGVILKDGKVAEPHEAERGNKAEEGVERVEEPGEDHHGVVEVDAHLHEVSGALDATGKIPVLVEFTLAVLALDGFVFEAALLDGAAPAVKSRSGILDTLVEGGTVAGNNGATEHFFFLFRKKGKAHFKKNFRNNKK